MTGRTGVAEKTGDARVDPYSDHPDNPKLVRGGSAQISISQLVGIIDNVSNWVDDVEINHPKLWGFTREDIKSWLEVIIDEAKKISNPKDGTHDC